MNVARRRLPVAHRQIMLDLVHKYNIRVFAEIGVNHGYMAQDIIRHLGGEMSEYWAIDVWRPYWKTHTKEQWERMYEQVCKNMSYFPILRVVRMDSTEVVEIFRDGYFDAVFLDTTHTYEDTKREITAWLPKIKKGGLFAGHDYGSHRKVHRGCKVAVDEIFPNVKVYPNLVFAAEV